MYKNNWRTLKRNIYVMTAPTKDTIRTVSKPVAFGPAQQSVELKNETKETRTIFIECLGGQCFSIAKEYQKLIMKPGVTIRIPIEFRVPQKAFAIAMRSTYRALVNVWVEEESKQSLRRLENVITLKAIAPRFVSVDSTHCLYGDKTSCHEETARSVS